MSYAYISPTDTVCDDIKSRQEHIRKYIKEMRDNISELKTKQERIERNLREVSKGTTLVDSIVDDVKEHLGNKDRAKAELSITAARKALHGMECDIDESAFLFKGTEEIGRKMNQTAWHTQCHRDSSEVDTRRLDEAVPYSYN